MMITRCPECATAFRITAEQMAARQGRVRCGHCATIFDAVAGLESEREAPAEEPRLANRPPQEAPPEEPEKEEELSDAPSPPEPAPVEEAAPDAAEIPSFLAPRTRRRFSPGWTAAVVLLLVALNAQALFYFRGAIALVQPRTKPYIERLCARLGCDLPLPRRAELMSIETSELQADPANPGVMVLSATLRNRAGFAQAYPALELTLTNDQDQPLARRVLQPGDYLAPAEAGRAREQGLASCAGGVPSCEYRVKLLFTAESLKASGYRLYLFYPS